MRVGRTWRSASSKAGCGESRAHATSPERQRSSRFSGAVLGDAAAQHALFPRRRRDLEALQLADDLHDAIRAVQLRAGRDVLPARQELMELRGGDRLDLAAQAAQSQVMNAGQDAAVAPFDLAGWLDCDSGPGISGLRDSSVASAMSNVADGQRQALGQFGCGDRAEAFHPAAHGGQRVVDGIAALGGDPEFGAAMDGKCPAGLRAVRRTTACHSGNGGAFDEGQQRVVQFIGIARVGPDFARHFARWRRDRECHSATSVREELRNCTARARRSSSGASSRKA